MSYRFLQGRGALLFAGAAILATAVAVTVSPVVSAQGPGGGQAPPQSPWAAAPIDVTGYWVSVVNEDWRWRMVTPPKGDVASVPLNDAARKVADSWDPASDGSCLAYGAGAGMRNPTRLHITWDGDNVVKIDMDAGVQTRRLMFAADSQPGARSLQGFSKAEWERVGGGRGGGGGGGGGAPQGGNLKVVTNNLTNGWLRKNGVPYSENAVVNEYFDRFAAPNGDQWLVVTTIVEDPMYLNQPFVTSTHFKKEPDASKWSPTPCKPTT